jgi:hypothetical protein
MSTNNVKHADPLKTKTGKTRLKPLNYRQLEDMLSKSQPKHRQKIQNRMRILAKKIGYVTSEKVEESVAETAAGAV